MSSLRTIYRLQRQSQLYLKCLACHSSSQPSQVPTSKPQSPGSSYVKPVSGLTGILANKFKNFVAGYESILEKRFPSAFRVYQVFTIGSKDLYNDVVKYLVISNELSYGKEVRRFSYDELIVYFQVPKDLMKVGPVLLVAALPFANYVVFPLAYLFPKLLLSSHFWNINQRVQFAVRDHKRKLFNYRPLFRHLQKKLSNIKDEELKIKCESVFIKLGSGLHPNVEEILEVKKIFTEEPFGIEYLTSRHMKSLCRVHGLSTMLGKRPRLWNHIGFVRELDLAIKREGINSLSLDSIRKACFMRGLNPMTLNREEMNLWLEQWIRIAENVDRYSLSLLLHSPLFLAYNHPANWRLIH